MLRAIRSTVYFPDIKGYLPFFMESCMGLKTVVPLKAFTILSRQYMHLPSVSVKWQKQECWLAALSRALGMLWEGDFTASLGSCSSAASPSSWQSFS